MSDSPETAKNRYQRDAAELATIAGGYDESELTLDAVEQMLTPTQDALLTDTFGLLNGIALGTITAGQPRIRDNLIRVIELIPSNADPKTVSNFMHFVRTTLSKAASAGLTAENQALTTRQPGRSR